MDNGAGEVTNTDGRPFSVCLSFLFFTHFVLESQRQLGSAATQWQAFLVLQVAPYPRYKEGMLGKMVLAAGLTLVWMITVGWHQPKEFVSGKKSVYQSEQRVTLIPLWWRMELGLTSIDPKTCQHPRETVSKGINKVLTVLVSGLAW